MKKTIKSIWNAATTVLVVLVLLLAMMLWGIRLFGLDVFVVQSGSMEPDYPVGSLVYIIETDPRELEVGDVITFRLSGTTRGTHRIVEVLEENGTVAFRTKGDNNEEVDNGRVPGSSVLGKVVFCLPQMGYFANYLQSAQGRYVSFAAIALILLLIIMPDLVFHDKKKTNVQEETQ